MSSTRLSWLLAVAASVLVANLYYTQPLIGMMCASLNFPLSAAGFLVTLPQLGYGIGLLTLVPLADLLENRRLILTLILVETVMVTAASLVTIPSIFLLMLLGVGTAAVTVQVLVPYVTYVTPVEDHGRAVGRVVSGVMLGIMLSRPLSSFAADAWGWRAIFVISAIAMGLLFVLLKMTLPERRPEPGMSYSGLLSSLGSIVATTEPLRRRSLYHACMFGSFTMFWTAVPLWLTSVEFGLSQRGVAWVALAGVGGAIAPPIAGRIADRGATRRGTWVVMLLASVAFAVSALAQALPRNRVELWVKLVPILVCAVALDAAVASNLVFGQRVIFSLAAAQRSRLNGLFMAAFFVAGAVASALSGWLYASFGWTGVWIAGAALPLLSLAYLTTEPKAKSP